MCFKEVIFLINIIEEINNEIEKMEKKLEGKKDNGLRGIIVEKYIKCGKENCRCAYGHKHGPYPHLQYYEKGKTKTLYIRKKIRDEVEKELEKNNEFRKDLKKLKKLYKKKKMLLQESENT